MKSSRKLEIYLLIITILCSGCIEEVRPPDIRNIKNKIVVNSVISPQLNEIIVQVSRSQKAFGLIADESGKDDLITDAQVKITNGVLTRTLLYNASEGHYSLTKADFPVEAGKNYKLEVQVGKEKVHAETNVPSKISGLKSARLNNQSVLKINWLDIAGEVNYYRISSHGFINDSTSQLEVDVFDFESDQFLTDLNRDGRLLSVKGKGFTNGYDRVSVRIISCNKIYYDYFKILSDHDEDDPFANPVQLPSNVVGGLGIFTAIRVSDFTVEL